MAIISIKKENILPKIEEYFTLRKQAGVIKSRMELLSSEMKDYAEKNGVKGDTGSSVVEVSNYVLSRVARKSVSLNQEKALSLAKEKNLTAAIKVVEYVDESALEKYIKKGAVSLEELEAVTETKVTYAIDLKEKEEMTEVTETKVLAASKKSRGR